MNKLPEGSIGNIIKDKINNKLKQKNFISRFFMYLILKYINLKKLIKNAKKIKVPINPVSESNSKIVLCG